MFKFFEPVTNCDQFVLLLLIERKGKIRRETFLISFDRLIEGLGGYAIELRQVGIDHDSFPADDENEIGNSF